MSSPNFPESVPVTYGQLIGLHSYQASDFGPGDNFQIDSARHADAIMASAPLSETTDGTTFRQLLRAQLAGAALSRQIAPVCQTQDVPRVA